MIALLGPIAFACSPGEPPSGPVGEVHEGPGLHIAPPPLSPPTPRRLFLDEEEFDVDIVELRTDDGYLVGEVWLPDTPLQEGQAWRYDDGIGDVQTGTVLGPRVDASFEILEVRHDAVLEHAACLSSGRTYQRLDVDLSVGHGAVVLYDVTTDEVAYEGELHDATVSYVREGEERRETCLQGEWLAVDGSIHTSEVVCSTDHEIAAAGVGCSTLGPVELTTMWVVAGLFGLRRRPRSGHCSGNGDNT